ncbi:response regulator [uncultured Methanomethylovorans sp.]|uniref:response regulator n=1 Tax=uncultured Methanomethylovorans sp. TaxID=183759 RepID=UPI0026068672|nr:response regulator [uncultured Methanomethylovorans sp.]
MKIRDKTLAILGITFIFLFALLIVTTDQIMGNSYERLEEKEVAQNVARASEALGTKVNTLAILARDYGAWDDTFYFVQGENEAYINETLTPSIVANLETNFILFYNSSRNLYYAVGVDLESAEEKNISSAMLEDITSTESLFTPLENQEIYGIINSPEGPLLIASYQITKTLGGESAGTIIFARYLDAAVIEELEETTKLSLNTEIFNQDDAASYPIISPLNSKHGTFYLDHITETTITGTTILEDINGNPILALDVEMPRDIYQQGQSTIEYVFYAILAIGFIFGLVLTSSLEKTVLSRLSLLSKNLTEITEKGSLSSRVQLKGNDELQNLADNINQMLGSLEEKEKVIKTLDLLESSLESIDAGIMVVDMNSRIIMNRKFIDMWEINVAVMSQNDVVKVLEHIVSRTKDYEENNISLEQLQNTSNKERITLNIKNGDTYDWYVGSIIHKEKIIGRVYCTTDITDSVKVQTLEQESKQRLETVLSNIISGVVLVDVQTHQIVDVNPIAEELIGLPKEKIVGNICHDFICPAHTGKCPITDLGSTVDRSEQVLINKDGTKIPILKSAITVTVADKNYLVESFVDMTTMKEAEKSLIESKVAAETANRAKSEFLATMSHELRTPLNAIIGFSDLMMGGSVGEVADMQKKFLGNISTSGKHLLSLINNVLDLSKIEAGKMELNYELFSAYCTIDEVKQLVSPLADKKGIKLEFIRDERLDKIYADRIRFKQILFNLASNAIKFTPQAGKITISAHMTDSMAQFTVTDTGIGISEENKSKLFQPFMQLDSAANRKYEGTGLGLSLVKQFVELHHGRIWFESELGKGTSFTFELPLQQNTNAEATAEAVRAEAVPVRSEIKSMANAPEPTLSQSNAESKIPAPKIMEPPYARGDEPLILVVEDDDASRELLEVTLVHEGYRVATAANGKTALEIANKLKPFAITLDIMMPGMDGWDVLRQLKEKDQTHDIPVIITSMMEDRKTSIVWGAVEHFIKPIQKEELLGTLNKIKANLSRSSLSVLVVDDERSTVELMDAMLRGKEFDVLMAYGGQEAIDTAFNKHPDVIVLDLMMPEVSGFDVIKALKSSPETIDIPVIICTAKDLDSDDKKSLAGNVACIVHKGMLTKDKLIDLIKTVEDRTVDKDHPKHCTKEACV